ncbi:hypothetical protein N658DRAFT_331615 [Parathielavia hyrcaniae]|uniref:Uncharacterized protein n=1 Tax=Parathielavia hyrcaniae TaxID=113614 RepID=A0AAN6PUF1_9PEZI|nr:hypothetical protein N658DRAFT_331615 [Parathielavia hyrcaniae]
MHYLAFRLSWATLPPNGPFSSMHDSTMKLIMKLRAGKRAAKRREQQREESSKEKRAAKRREQQREEKQQREESSKEKRAAKMSRAASQLTNSCSSSRHKKRRSAGARQRVLILGRETATLRWKASALLSRHKTTLTTEVRARLTGATHPPKSMHRARDNPRCRTYLRHPSSYSPSVNISRRLLVHVVVTDRGTAQVLWPASGYGCRAMNRVSRKSAPRISGRRARRASLFDSNFWADGDDAPSGDRSQVTTKRGTARTLEGAHQGILAPTPRGTWPCRGQAEPS